MWQADCARLSVGDSLREVTYGCVGDSSAGYLSRLALGRRSPVMLTEGLGAKGHAGVVKQSIWKAALPGLVCVLTACAGTRDMPSGLPERGVEVLPSPGLLPLSELIAQAADGPATARLTQGPDTRAAALQARAAALRGPVITPPERSALQDARHRLP
ncbi:MAG: hypothetical protein ACXIU7_11730 [Roseinatronobacter sp.]